MTPGVAKGGHFLSKESLPTALVARRLEALHAEYFPKQFITNDHHPEMDLILALMIAGLFTFREHTNLGLPDHPCSPSPSWDAENIGPNSVRISSEPGLQDLRPEVALSLILLYTHSKTRYKQPDLSITQNASVTPQLRIRVNIAIERLCEHFHLNIKAVPSVLPKKETNPTKAMEDAQLKVTREKASRRLVKELGLSWKPPNSTKSPGQSNPSTTTRTKRKRGAAANVPTANEQGSKGKKRKNNDGLANKIADKAVDKDSGSDGGSDSSVDEDDEDDEALLDRLMVRVNKDPITLAEFDITRLLELCASHSRNSTTKGR